jgi:hypothetical protein
VQFCVKRETEQSELYSDDLACFLYGPFKSSELTSPNREPISPLPKRRRHRKKVVVSKAA